MILNFLKNNRLHIVGFLIIIISLLFLVDIPYDKKEPPVIIDIQQIINRGKLIAITENNSTDYFIYRGHPMGFQLEMLQLFVKHIGVKLDLRVVNNKSQAINKLVDNKCDIVAVNVPYNKDYAEKTLYTIPYAHTHYVLVQRKPVNRLTLSKDSVEQILIRSFEQLKGKTVFVPAESFLYNEIDSNYLIINDNTIFISKVAGMGYSELTALVESGEIDYAISDEQTASLNKIFYPNLDFNTVLTTPHSFTWCVRASSVGLLDSLNSWLKDFILTKEYKYIYAKYFKNPAYKRMINDKYFPLQGGKISPYDEEMKKLSVDLGWDWRLLASLVFQESKFDTGLIGVGGSMGIMQLMPATASNYGIDSTSGPVENLKAGVRYLKWLNKHYSNGIDDINERIYFILAAYNVGHGHVDDARALTKKYNHNPNLWYGNVESFLRLKSKSQYYQDPVVKSGYCRCTAVSRYVDDVIQRYKHYVNATIK